MGNEETTDSDAELIAQVRRSLGTSAPEESSVPPATSLVEVVEDAPQQSSLQIAEPAMRIADQLLGEGPPREADFAFDSDSRLAVEVEGRRFTVPPDGIELGRSLGSRGIVVADSRISRRHARFVCQGEGIAVMDLGSTNGTTVLRSDESLRVESEPIELKQGDRIATLNDVLLAEIVSNMAG